MAFGCVGGTHSGGDYFGQQGLLEGTPKYGLLEVTLGHLHNDYNRMAPVAFDSCGGSDFGYFRGWHTVINIDNSSRS